MPGNMCLSNFVHLPLGEIFHFITSRNAWGLCSVFDSNWNQNKNSCQQGFKKFLFEHRCLHSDCWHEPSTSLQGEVIKTHQQINPTRITHIFLSVTMTWTQFYCKDESKVMQEGFFQIPFPHSPCAVSSYSILARYIPKTYKPENSPRSLLTAAFVLVSVLIFLSGSEGIQRSTLNSVSESFHHFCDVA